jgi:TRAP-type C4-dicarboxylate transport system substrate-binding protein
MKEMLDAVQSGLANMTNPVPAYFPAQLPLGTLTFVPFACSHRIDLVSYQWNLMSQHPVWQQQIKPFNAVYAFYPTVNPYNIMSRKPIRTVEDFRGLKIRALGDQATLFKMFGATPVACTAPEIYTALERGLVDAVAGCGEWWFANWKIFDALKDGGYFIDGIDMNPAGGPVLINKDSYDALPPDIKLIIEGLKWEVPAIVHENYASKEVTQHFRDKFRKAGIKMSTFPPEERAKMVAKAETIWNKWKERKHNKRAGSHEFFKAWMETKEKLEKDYPEGIYREGPLPEEVKKLVSTH